MLARTGLLVALAAALTLAACALHEASSSGPAANGTLVGRIVRGPIFTISGPGVPVPPPRPLAVAELKILNSQGSVAATVRTDADGFYRVTLPPGHYRVEHGETFRGATKDLPATVTVMGGQQTRLDVTIDTGIR